MRTRLFPMLVGGAALMFSTSVHPQQAPDAASAAASQQAVVTRYCVTCHNERAKTGGLSLETLSVSSVGEQTDVWEKVVQKLHANLMPPPDRPRPDQSTLKNLLSYLETSLDRAADAKPDPGRTEALHRLNRAEYRNAVRDLLALDIDVSAMLPADDVSYGFDNIAGVQRMSPTLMERYLAAAQKISSVAVGASPRAATTETFLVPPELQQNARVEGLPFGTRGGTAIRHTFPRDGVYSIRVQLTRYAGASFDEVPVFDEPQRLELSVDGTPVHVFELPPAAHTEGRGTAERIAEVSMPTGLSASRRRRDLETSRSRFSTGRLRCSRICWSHFRGRLQADQTATTRLRRAPTFAVLRLAVRMTRPAPATRRAASASSRAVHQRPATSTCAQRRSSPRWRVARSGGLSSTRICRPCSRCIRRVGRNGTSSSESSARSKAFSSAPNFSIASSASRRRVQRVQRVQLYRISDLELASRLSFFLWSSIPDDALLDAASAGKLQNPARLEQQARRMLADSRAEALVTNFVGQWLFLRNLSTILPDPKRESDFDEDLRQGLRRETELFAGSILREDRSVLDLLTANHTFVNERRGETLRHSAHSRPALPPHRAQRRSPPRAPWPGKRACGYIVPASHVAGCAGKVDSGESSRHSAASAAAGCAGARGKTEPGRRREVDAFAHCAASREPEMRQLSRDDGPAGIVARKFRHGGAVARG